MPLTEHEVYPLYHSMWQDALPAIERNDVEVDPHLAGREQDARRGISVLARPSADVRERIERFVAPLRQVEPRQHYHQPRELHITVLSLFTATEQHAPYFARAAEYVEAVRHAMRNARPLTIAFEGITASRGVVMVQGFPAVGALADMRESLRDALAEAGLGAGLDQRYRVRASHISVMRFAAPLADPRRTGEYLRAHRETPFGTCTIEQVETSSHDWYMSPDAFALMDTHTLRAR